MLSTRYNGGVSTFYRTKSVKSQTLRPDYIASSVDTIDYKLLARKGIKAVIFDIDCTLVAHNSHTIDPKVAQRIRANARTHNLTIAIASNTKRNVDSIAKALDATVVMTRRDGHRKPQRRFYATLLKRLNSEPSEAVMIGDRLIADSFGANRAGLYTIAVEARFGNSSIEHALLRHYWQPWLLRIASLLP